MHALYIENSSGEKLASLYNKLAPLNRDGKVLEFSDYLSSYGELRFRLQRKDPILENDIFVPYQYHVKLYRDNVCVWSGIIVNLPHRTNKYIEVVAYTYEFLLVKVQVAHSPGFQWREFTSGSMATAVTTLFNEGKNRANSTISDFTLGTVENPDYPWAPGTEWTFTTTYNMPFSFSNLFQVINSYADITNADFTVTKDKVFSFKKRIGQERPDISLQYRKNVEDYDAPVDGSGFTNDFVLASFAKDGYTIIRSEKQDTSTFGTYGRLWSSEQMNDSLEQNVLNAKADNIYKLKKDIDTETQLLLNEKALPIGSYSLGDTINIKIDDGQVQINRTSRVVGWKVTIDDRGVEKATIITNRP